MFRRLIGISSTLIAAFFIVSVSVLRAASIDYVISPQPTVKPVLGESVDEEKEIAYFLPFPGKILPDHSLWFLKAARDRVWLTLTLNSQKKMDLLLLFADKRLAGSQVLFEREKADLGFSTLSKAEKYLEEAFKLEEEKRMSGTDTKSFLTKIALASLKHQETIEEILLLAPEEVKPEIIKIGDYPREVYKGSRDALFSLGMTAPENPFSEN